MPVERELEAAHRARRRSRSACNALLPLAARCAARKCHQRLLRHAGPAAASARARRCACGATDAMAADAEGAARRRRRARRAPRVGNAGAGLAARLSRFPREEVRCRAASTCCACAAAAADVRRRALSAARRCSRSATACAPKLSLDRGTIEAGRAARADLRAGAGAEGRRNSAPLIGLAETLAAHTGAAHRDREQGGARLPARRFGGRGAAGEVAAAGDRGERGGERCVRDAFRRRAIADRRQRGRRARRARTRNTFIS